VLLQPIDETEEVLDDPDPIEVAKARSQKCDKSFRP
jgi:hypothetical protein